MPILGKSLFDSPQSFLYDGVTATLYANLKVKGTISSSGGSTVENVIPDADNTFSLGSAADRFKYAYLGLGVINSVAAAVAAAGTNLATATQLTASKNLITSGTVAQGVKLNASPVIGQSVSVQNDVSANTVLLYPNVSGATITLNGVAQSVGAAIALAFGVQYQATYVAANAWNISSYSNSATVNAAVTATGTTLGTAAVLTNSESIITVGASTTGATLNPALAIGQTQLVINAVAANQINLYPDASGNTITYNGFALGAGAAIGLVPNYLYRATRVTATNWEVTGQPIKGGTNGRSGTFTANGASTVSVATTAFTANSNVIITLKTANTPGAQPHLITATPGTGFAVVATAGDTSVYNWAIVESVA